MLAAQCRACSGASQFRLMLCHDCWRLLPPIVLREWNWARTSSAKLVVAELVAIWADAYREALATMGPSTSRSSPELP